MLVRKMGALAGRLAVVAALAAGVAACDSSTETDHLDAEGLVVVDEATDQVLATVNAQRQVTGALEVAAGEGRAIEVFFLDDAGNRFQLPPGGDETLRWTVANTAVAEIDEHDGHLDLDGVAAGSTTVKFEIYHVNHPDYTSPDIPITVTP